MTKLKGNMTISIIIGSTGQGRFSEKPARWILQELRKREAVEARLLDLRDPQCLSSTSRFRQLCRPGRLTNTTW